MKVQWKDAGEVDRLRELIAAEGNTKQRDCYRVVLLAGAGLGDAPECKREQIAAIVGRSRQFVDQWVGRYRQGGLGLLVPKKQAGARSKLTLEQQQELLKWLEEGPWEQEKLAAYNGPILRERIQERFGKLYSLNGIYALLHRLGYNDLMPRTTHPDTEPAVLESFKKKSSPEALEKIRQAHPTQRLLRYYQDEARFGQHGTITRVWAKVGTRPRAIQQNQYDYLYVFAAVCPETGAATGLIAPEINTQMMNAFLEQFSKELPADVYAVMVLDRAGWHVAKALNIPANVTLIHLPPNHRSSIGRRICGTTCAATTGPIASIKPGPISKMPPSTAGDAPASCQSCSRPFVPTRPCAGIRCDPDETEFEVDRSTDGTNWSVLTYASNGSSGIVDSSAAFTTQYLYEVRAINGATVTSFSANATAPAVGLGDANVDGRADLSDLNIVLNHLGMSSPISGVAVATPAKGATAGVVKKTGKGATAKKVVVRTNSFRHIV